MVAREYIIESTNRFKCITREVKKGKEIIREHYISRVKRQWLCDCQGYSYSNPLLKSCKHIRDIRCWIDDGLPIMNLEEREFDWKDLIGMTRRFG